MCPSRARRCSRCRILAGPAVSIMTTPYARGCQNRTRSVSSLRGPLKIAFRVPLLKADGEHASLMIPAVSAMLDLVVEGGHVAWLTLQRNRERIRSFHPPHMLVVLMVGVWHRLLHRVAELVAHVVRPRQYAKTTGVFGHLVEVEHDFDRVVRLVVVAVGVPVGWPHEKFPLLNI